jgi:hypothetical protein
MAVTPTPVKVQTQEVDTVYPKGLRQLSLCRKGLSFVALEAQLGPAACKPLIPVNHRVTIKDSKQALPISKAARQISAAHMLINILCCWA